MTSFDFEFSTALQEQIKANTFVDLASYVKQYDLDNEEDDLHIIFEIFYLAYNIDFPDSATDLTFDLVRDLFKKFGLAIFEFKKGIYILNKISFFAIKIAETWNLNNENEYETIYLRNLNSIIEQYNNLLLREKKLKSSNDEQFQTPNNNIYSSSHKRNFQKTRICPKYKHEIKSKKKHWKKKIQ